MSVDPRPQTKPSRSAGGGVPAVFLDRDNTLIHNDGDLGDPDAVDLVQGAAMAVASLRGLGFVVIGVTNQGGVARGRYGEDDVHAVHERIDALLERGANGASIAGWYFCPHHPRGTVEAYTREHPDRKPAPGMLLRAAEEHGIDLRRSWMVGDSLRDTQAGEAAGCRTVLLHPEAGRLSPARLSELAAEHVATQEEARGDNLSDASGSRAAAEHRPDFFAGTIVEAVRVIASQRHTERGRTAERSAASPARRPSTPDPRVTEAPATGKLASPTTPSGDGAKAEPTPPARPAGRAFRPLTLPPEEETGPLVEPDLQVTTMLERAMKRARGRGDVAADAAEHAPAEEPAATPSGQAEPPAAERGAAPPGSVPAGEPRAAAREPERARAAAAPEPVAAPSPPASAAPPSTEPADADTKLLGQILHELRGQRGTGGDASASTLVACVLQAVAAVCLLGALWMAADDDSLFQRWALATLFFQGATLTTLLLKPR